MAKRLIQGPASPVWIVGADGEPEVQNPSWYYLSGQTLTNPNNVALTLPSLATSIVISMETGPGYYAINGAASAASPGYIPTDGMQSVGPIANLTSFNVHSPTGIAHVMYWREA